MGTLLIERIDGAFDNVVGLPLRATLKLMERVLEAAIDDGDGIGDAEEGEDVGE